MKQRTQNVFVSLGHVAWVIVAFIIAIFAISLPLAFAGGELARFADSSVGSLIFSTAIYVLAALLAIVPLIVRNPSLRVLLPQIGLARKPTVKMFGWALLLWAGYFLVALIVNIILYYIDLPWLNLEQRQEIGFQNLIHGYEYVAAFVALVVVAPVFEEIMFRGYLFGRLRRRHAFIASALVTSIVFGAVHMQLNVAIDVFVLSMFMCVARERFDSIYPAIFMHMFKNGFAYFFLFIAPLIGINLV